MALIVAHQWPAGPVALLAYDGSFHTTHRQEGETMKHTTEELILAAHVREIAQKLRDAQLERECKVWEQMSMQPNDEEGRAKRAEFRSSWLASHKVASFAKEALSHISAVADALKAD